ncbi:MULTISPECIES: S-methyl-5-thioribose-1-phosphate isomerase [unclassified Pseudomonas]|uniref:S-methyl-5-thioribose-1-phosphate isomerase n=1 Tax=Pseudomonas TaxID=286 RepID=UPI000BA08BBF|nr:MULTISPECIES: S-methyl-5-thioribose-1-phosphate isomerase [unclassified Pseudomonas]MCV2229310.1 S-methyl-5-thioribose-1-phosphate isomerase [Pseudomonas sp. AU10]OZO01837.1 S-methyl-5-thioribose-1-phosphate isomerase [Pseudomonas sp. IB20]UNM21752.1 S-methyl-5-thioribose-1-phosphate isomerase [Pseudomonas sp. ArH3a]UXZ24458.1 S-methyl-5-thioribose-1-phosphate isomerase [Pseudomonas sp. YeP6b]
MRDRLLAAEKVKAIQWRDGALHLLDQRALPSQESWVACTTVAEVADAIRTMVVRGASAIGISAAYGLVLAARESMAEGGDWQAAWEEGYALLADTRPTASNLFWALKRMRDRLDRVSKHADPLAALEAEAIGIHESDREANVVMAQLGLERIRKHQGNPQAILTHGNTGALATGGVGTALGVIRAAFLEGLVERVYVNETRPWLQGSRLTAWELAGEGIPVTVNTDSAGAHILKTKGVTWVVVGADCIAANGDVVSKIGTYQLAVCAMHHGVRFMVVAPSSTLDLMMATGDDVALEERDPGELLDVMGQRLEVAAFNPVFDVTPADLIDVIVTEKGVVERPDTAKLAKLMCRKRLH